MKNEIKIAQLKKMLYGTLRWRLQLPQYVPHNPIPDVNTMSVFHAGMILGYRDILEGIERITKDPNYFEPSRKRNPEWFYGNKGKESELLEEYLEEIRNNIKHWAEDRAMTGRD